MECRKGNSIKKWFKYVALLLLLPFVLALNVYGVETTELEQATVVNWVGAAYTKEDLAAYDAQYKINVEPSQVTVGKSNWTYGNEIIDLALDDNWDNGHWGAGGANNENDPTFLEVDFGETVEIGQLVYRTRTDMNRGFPLEFKIQIATEENGEFKDAVEGSASPTKSLIAIKFETKQCRKLRFVWKKVEDSYPCASVFYCYKNDGWEAGEAEVGNWPIAYLTEEERAAYNEQYLVETTKISSNKGHYPGSPIENAGDADWNTHFEANSSDGKGTYIEVAFAEIQEVGQVVYSPRQDADGKGFPLKFKIQGSIQDSGENFVDIATGSATKTQELIKISFPETKCKRLRFVWEEAYNGWPSCSVFYCYKEDNLAQELKDLFVDGVGSALKPNVTQEDINLLAARVAQYPVKETLQSYIELANALISGENLPERMHEPITLSQFGDRVKEKERTQVTLSLSNWDVTGYYVRPGDVIEVFVDADINGPMPRLVLGEVARKYDSWQFGYDGMVLDNGLNYVKVPETMKGCQVIYFYNPALPADQEYAPLVRLCGGEKYPVYYYDSKDSVEVAKEKEKAFLQEVTEYCIRVNNNMNEAALGDGEPNICEYVSDKIQISTSAKAVAKYANSSYVWQHGEYREWAEENEPKHAVVERDENNQVTGIRYQGPAAVMEAYEMLFEDMQLYCGFNTKDITHEDYRNHGKFVLRSYNDGWGGAWAQQCYSGYNMGSVDWESPMENGWYKDLITADAIVTGSWTVYHEIGHQFDSAQIGTSESTNNLFGLSAQFKYLDQTRMEDDNRWYNHFTHYVNTGILPYDDLLFYPGAVILQLDGVNFIGKSIYSETDISNYGRACRYARLHKEELEGLSVNDKMVVSFSMACGVDLSSHFEFYGREVSEDARVILSGLPKETRPTWLVTERTFRGGEFSEADKAKTPEIVSYEVNEENGNVTLTMASDVFTEENVQCFAIYRQKKVGENLVGNVEFVGVTGDNLSTKNVNEIYQFTDTNGIPGVTYVYSVGVYDCTLIENTNKATVEIGIPLDAEVPVTSMQINDNSKAVSVAVGVTYKVRAEYFPINATVDLTQMRWWAEGYGEDTQKTGAGPDSLLILSDPDYPGDPTRKLVKGIQPGQTTLYVSLGNMRQNLRISVNNNMAVEDNDTTKYLYEFKNNPSTFKVGETYNLNLYRTTCDAEGVATSEVVKVVNTPNIVTWESSAIDAVTVTNKGQITVVGMPEGDAKEVTISFMVRENVKATYTFTVVQDEVAVEEILISDEDKDGISMKVGENRKITYNLLPANTTQAKDVVISSDNSCVRVENDGTITAVAGGTANITVSVGEIRATLSVVVESYIPLKGIMLNKEEVILNGAGSVDETLSVIKIPEDATVSTENVVWTSSNESIFTVENGQVTAVGSGTADLIVSLEGKTTTIPVTVAGADIVLEGISFRGLAAGEELVLKEGKTHQLVLNINPTNATSLSSTQWKSSDENVATVSYGYITALSKGQTVITATVIQNEGTEDEIRREVSCIVKVESADVVLEGMVISHKQVNLDIGDKYQLVTSLRPANANVTADGKPIEPVVWSVEDETIATVDANGIITAIKVGTTTVTAVGNGFNVSCQVNVDDEVKAKVIGYSLSLEGNIGVNYHMELGENVITDENAYMNFTLDGKQYMKVYLKEATHKNEGYYVFKCTVPVKDMDKAIAAQIVLSDGRKSSVFTYKVKNYADYILANEKDYSVETIELVSAMNDFGKYATTYFADGTLEETDAMKEVDASDLINYQATIPEIEDSIYYGSSLLLKSDTILRHYFKEKVEVAGYEVLQKGNLYYIETKGIPAHELGDEIVITVGDMEIAYSPLSYAYIALSRDNVDENLKGVMRAMYLYYEAAQDYLEANK